MNIKHRIDIANTLLSWRLTQQIESAYSRIMEIRGRHDGSREYSDAINNMNWQQFEPIVFDGLTGSSCASKELDYETEIRWLKDINAKQQFIRSAVWFWCLLFGHWEYYESYA